MRHLGIFVPSRGRPHNAARLWKAMQDTCTDDTTLLIGLDEDDETRYAYPRGPGYVIRPGLHYVTAWVNVMAADYADGYTAIGHFGDDNVPETKGWDEEVMAALAAYPFAFANDCYPTRPPGSLSCHIFMRGEVYRKLGYFGPPSIRHMYVDVAWYAWGTACGIKFLDDVIIRHVHYTLGAQHDETYARSWAITGSDLAAWHAYSRLGLDDGAPGGLNADITKLGGTWFTADQLARFNRDLNIPERWPY